MRKRILRMMAMIAAFCVCLNLYAQKKEKVARYETIVYTSDKIDLLIQNENRKQSGGGERGYLSDMGKAVLNAGKGVAGGYVTSFIDIGVNAVASLLTKNANDKVKWEEIVKSENMYQETLSTVEPINNFYMKPSFDGPLDPAGMNFGGIGCLKTVDGDTVFYISCHIDESKISRIINHSKFELSLDTLIINPFQLDLPNSNFDTQFSFDKRKNLQIAVEMRLISSWINELTELQKDQELGRFMLSVAINPAELDSNNKLRYVRTQGSESLYKIAGESFVVPRSYIGFRDADKTYKNSWGTGDYNIELVIKETCGITDDYRKNWKTDWKKRQDADNDENFVQMSWKMISSQRWNEITKQWVVTTLKAPADMVTADILKELDLPAAKAATGSAAAAKQGGGR